MGRQRNAAVSALMAAQPAVRAVAAAVTLVAALEAIAAAVVVAMGVAAAVGATEAKSPLTPYSNKSPWITRNDLRRCAGVVGTALSAASTNLRCAIGSS